MRALISTEETAGLIESGSPVLLDVRWRLAGPPAREDYARAHLPGAVFTDIDTDLADPPSTERGRHPLPDPERLAERFRAAGISAHTPVIAYDDADGSVAARAWWLLRWLGHAEVAVLDGGFAAWEQDGRALSTEIPTPERGNLRAEPGAMPVLDADGAAALAAEGLLLDARAHERYLGGVEPVDARAGHIPLARNSPTSTHLGADRRWRGQTELAAHFARLGVDSASTVGVYCGSGVTACAAILAIEHAEVGGSTPALYSGSFSQWSADMERPVATGDEPD